MSRRIYVEKIVDGKPCSIVGPFDDREQAIDYIHRSQKEAHRSVGQALGKQSTVYNHGVEYHIIDQDQIDT